MQEHPHRPDQTRCHAGPDWQGITHNGSGNKRTGRAGVTPSPAESTDPRSKRINPFRKRGEFRHRQSGSEPQSGCQWFVCSDRRIR